MDEIGFAPAVSEEEAWSIVQAKAPKLRRSKIELRQHPFSGFIYRFRHPGSKRLLEERLHTLVDRFTGSAFITEAWAAPVVLKSLSQESRVSDPHWRSITFEEARQRATEMIRAASLRRYRLMLRRPLEELESYELIWKPNWLLTGTLMDRQLRILVDGLNGSFYVVGS